MSTGRNWKVGAWRNTAQTFSSIGAEPTNSLYCVQNLSCLVEGEHDEPSEYVGAQIAKGGARFLFLATTIAIGTSHIHPAIDIDDSHR